MSATITRPWAGLAVLALPTLVLALDQSVLYLALPHLSADLGADATQSLWILDVYGFMLAGSLLTMGALGDRLGRRRLLLAGAAAFGIATVGAAYATSPAMLIGMRAVMGIAGATLDPGADQRHILPAAAARHRDRGLVRLPDGRRGIGPGPRRGLARLVLVGIGVPGRRTGDGAGADRRPVRAARVPQPRSRPDRPAQRGAVPRRDPADRVRDQGAGRPGHHDPARSRAGRRRPRRRRVPGPPATPPGPAAGPAAVPDPHPPGALIILLFGAFTTGGTYLLVGLYLQDVVGLSPLHAGLWLVPAVAAAVLGAMITPGLSTRWPAELVIAAGLALTAAGYVLLTQVGPDPSGLPGLLTGFVLAFLGGGPIGALGTTMVVGAAPPEKAGVAASTSETSTDLGVALGIAMLGTTGTAVYRATLALPADLPTSTADAARESIAGATAAATTLPAEPAAQLLAHAASAFTAGLHTAAAIGAVLFAVLALRARTALRPACPDTALAQAAAAAGKEPTRSRAAVPTHPTDRSL